MKHYLKSACWLLGEKGVSFFCVLLVNFQVAKYLGPDLFGSFSFAQAISSLLLILSGLGIHNILLRDFSNVNSRKDILYAASLLLRGGFSIIILLLAFILYRKSILTIEVTIFTLLCLPQTFFYYENILQSKGQGKTIAISKISGSLTSALLKLSMIYYDCGIIYIILCYVLESVIISAFYVFHGRYLLKSAIKNIDFSLLKSDCIYLLKKGAPLLFSGIMVIAYTRTDQLMIKSMWGESALGFYSAAIRVSEALNFLPYLIFSAIFPIFIKKKRESLKSYETLVSRSFSIVLVFSFLISWVVYTFSEKIITLAYGIDYTSSIPVLALSCWGFVFISIGAVSSKWLLAEDLQKYSLMHSIIGLLINVLMNLALIPKFGIIGASISTLISLFFSSLLLYLMSSKTRKLVLIFFRSVLLWKF